MKVTKMRPKGKGSGGGLQSRDRPHLRRRFKWSGWSREITVHSIQYGGSSGSLPELAMRNGPRICRAYSAISALDCPQPPGFSVPEAQPCVRIEPCRKSPPPAAQSYRSDHVRGKGVWKSRTLTCLGPGALNDNNQAP